MGLRDLPRLAERGELLGVDVGDRDELDALGRGVAARVAGGELLPADVGLVVQAQQAQPGDAARPDDARAVGAHA